MDSRANILHFFSTFAAEFNKITKLKTFKELGLCDEILKAIEEQGYEQPMPVQEEVIPYLLGVNNDVVALAQTGTGKTAAYGLPVLQKLDPARTETQALVLSPTRELCLQIADDLENYSKYISGVRVLPVYGGASIEHQIRALKRGVQVIVATPGRLIDLMERGAASLEHVENVVLDEADEMLSMGFSESIDTILAGVPEQRNTLLFSATMSKEIERIAKKYLRNAREIVVGSRNEGAENVNHVYYLVQARDKYLALKRIVDYYPKIYAIIFCRTRVETQEIADKLIQDGYNADALHGELSQQQRDLTMQKFRQHRTQFLVATDVAARGLDVDDLTHVINYGMPDDIENYTHRSGRTGRAGKKGTSIAIIHTRERHKIRAVEKEIGKEFVAGKIPTPQEICTKQLYKVMDEIVKVDVDDEQIAPFMAEINRHFEFIDKEDIIKKIVSQAFGRFLAYYADAPEIDAVDRKERRGDRREKKGERGSGRQAGRGGGRRKAEQGYRRLFINLGKDDGFYPGEIMQYVNRHVEGRQEVGHIDLLGKFSYIEVPEQDARKVIRALNGTRYKGRDVRCNDADEGGSRGTARQGREERGDRKASSGRSAARPADDSERFGKRSRQRQDDAGKTPKGKGKRDRRGEIRMESGRQDDWRQFFQGHDIQLIGDEPDFSEEGWARRKPKKDK